MTTPYGVKGINVAEGIGSATSFIIILLNSARPGVAIGRFPCPVTVPHGPSRVSKPVLHQLGDIEDVCNAQAFASHLVFFQSMRLCTEVVLQATRHTPYPCMVQGIFSWSSLVMACCHPPLYFGPRRARHSLVELW